MDVSQSTAEVDAVVESDKECVRISGNKPRVGIKLETSGKM
jgi:hypothetical protein